MNNRSWAWHHVPYILIAVVSIYLITEPGSHHSAPLVLYLFFLPLPLLWMTARLRK